MKKYEIVLLVQRYETYNVLAESKEEAFAEAFGGNVTPRIEPCDVSVIEVNEGDEV